MALSKSGITIELKPQARLDVIDVKARVREQAGDLFSRYRKALYCSYHTTAGYFEQNLCARLNHDRDSLRAFVRSFRKIFPPNADYLHDQLHLRTELSEQDRKEEPKNADSHLTFIGSGLSSSAIYENSPNTPVFLVDLDGIYGNTRRRRQTTVIGFSREKLVKRLQFAVPVSGHPIDSVSLADSRVGLFEELNEMVNRYGIERGRLDISLAQRERRAGLTVNEYETLLMKHDLAEVLRNPLRFMAEKGKHMLQDPRAIPSKAKNYAKYDFVQVVNEFLDILGLSESLVERVIDKFMAFPAERFLRLKRSVSLPVYDRGSQGKGSIIQGAYQSPVLVQWEKAKARTRLLDIRFIRFE